MSEIKTITAREFYERGYLQEVNRQFLHPLGLALCVSIDCEDPEDKGEYLSVWDYRDDPEGMEFGGPDGYGLDARKALNVEEDRLSHEAARKRLWGQVIQPLDNALDKR
jgi:hypothetical protein